jgi:hypothetical protein
LQDSELQKLFNKVKLSVMFLVWLKKIHVMNSILWMYSHT